jgi:hypothetical protein
MCAATINSRGYDSKTSDMSKKRKSDSSRGVAKLQNVFMSSVFFQGARS